MDPVQLAAYVSGMPGFDRANTPSYRMGRLAEHVRTRPAAVRSAHPQSSFAAYGPSAASLMATHDLDCHLGERSPLAALYDANASILLLGVGFDRCTALHLAEHRVPWRPPSRTYRCYVHVDTVGRQTRDFVDVALDASDFDKLGEDLAREPFVTCGVVGNTTAIVLPLVQMVGYAVGWMTTHRQP
jgi:aminoglycoside 3-N-acetyltransferase